jgi:DNA-binding ferritin-like protein
MKETIILYLMECSTQIKFLHWNTYQYSTHKSLGKLYDGLSESIDTFVEMMMGTMGRPDFPDTFSLQFEKPENVNPTDYLTQLADYLISLSDELDPRTNSDLLNQRDEMLGMVNQTKYLLTLTK